MHDVAITKGSLPIRKLTAGAALKSLAVTGRVEQRQIARAWLRPGRSTNRALAARVMD